MTGRLHHVAQSEIKFESAYSLSPPAETRARSICVFVQHLVGIAFGANNKRSAAHVVCVCALVGKAKERPAAAFLCFLPGVLFGIHVDSRVFHSLLRALRAVLYKPRVRCAHVRVNKRN
jgi:hypothetical protein